MADELEPQEVEVPEQAEFFTQTIGEALEAPDPEPEPKPAPEPEPEPEVPPVEPDWLNQPPPQPQQEQWHQQQGYPQDYPQQRPQQPQAQPRTGGDAALEAFVENPDAWLEQRLQERLAQYSGPLQQQQQSIAFMMQQMVDNSVKQGKGAAEGAIRKAYTAFNKDATFRSSKAMQEKIGATLQGMVQRAEYEARNGNFAPMNAIANLSDADIAGTLAYVRAVSGASSPGTGPMQIEGATVESSRAAVADKTVELTPEQEEVARRMGPAYRRKMEKAVVEQKKYNDLEWRD